MNTAVCANCHRTCATCNGLTDGYCLTCPTSSNRVTNPVSGKCDCLPGFYDDGSTSVCQPCHFSCSTCMGPNSNQCITCPSGANRDDNSATGSHDCPCSARFYEKNVLLCGACDISCGNCSGPASNQCLTCSTTSNRITTPSSGSCSCLPGFYSNAAVVCPACHQSCATCSGGLSTNCLTCPDPVTTFRNNNSLTNGSCPCQSPYNDVGVQICSQCHFSCKTCSGPNANQCLTCPTFSVSGRKNPIGSLTECVCDKANGYY